MVSDHAPAYQETTGFFGKVPGAGDFVARGLSPGVRGVLDRFLTTKLGQAAHQPERWPKGGIRAAITGPSGPLLLCVVPSLDAHKRAFPVAACVALNKADQTAADAWAEAVIDPLWHEDQVEALYEALRTAPKPASSETPISVPTLWQDQTAPQDPDQAIRELF
ncbi:type VI secretion system-associated protein TagF [Shimia sagamensis]|uniref:Type VI secretion-associated protein, BMA_A0400 family n=1 Tax=Shimia sagamensis TaxID=1566352 RepID=A0ABY1PLV1_9RHOB|nr:type VI secretion system-associated protein TagF [Shimia sagamensis]SMP34730.1 type VI secretion-associated protein, BMA_A0400 family [Shimia sagamensis]